MIKAAELAGFFGAHAILSVSDGDTLIPILAFANAEGKRSMERLLMGDLESAVEYGNGKLEANENEATSAVLLFDGRIPVDDAKMDAIIIQLRAYSPTISRAIIAIPYTPKSQGGFLVHRAKVLKWDSSERYEIDQVFEAFFKGVAAHDQGSEIWKSSFDDRK